ncbi:restriction endonuclease subunit S [Lactobacillus helveticus]|uniref:restriction endonuclease subunit S n=1 Tax=Lactobacillus helveticus TaxID=1587 RepID=UPI0030CB9FE9
MFVNPQIVNSKPVHINDIVVVVRNGSRKLIGKHVLIQHELHDTVIGAFMTGIRSSNNFFINATLDSQLFKKEIQKNLGSTINQITVKNFQNMAFGFPSKIEKDKIGKLFRIIGNIISLQQRKLKLLKVMKKALSQYMFCQETEFVPILRFNSFSDKWKYERLKKLIVKEIKGKAKADMKGTKSTYIDTALLNGGSITKVDSPTDTFHNDIIILWDGSQAGKIYHGFTGALGSTLKSYKPKYSGGFLYQYLKSKEPIIFLRYRTPNIPHVVKDFTEIFKINVPSVKEQEKISKTLNYLDQSILVETKKIGSIKKIKKFLLQNMFI